MDENPEVDPSDYELSDETAEIDFDVEAEPVPEPFDSGDCAWDGEPDYWERQDGV